MHSSVKEAFRNVYDNLFSQKSSIAEIKASSPSAKNPGASPADSPSSGTYFPNLFNTTNLDGSTPYTCQWFRIGNVVSVSGRVDVNPTAAGATKLGISIPVPTNVQFVNQLAGVAACPTVAGEVAPIAGDTGNNRAQMSWVTTNTTNEAMFFTFQYLVN